MIHKNINKFFLFLFILSFYSCQTTQLFEKKIIYSQDYEDVYENDSLIDINIFYKKNKDNIDYYSPFFINNWDNFSKFTKINKINLYSNKYEKIKPISPIIFNDNLIIVSDYASISFYDYNNFLFKYKIDLDIDINPKESFPISFTKINDSLFISYSNGLLISFNIEGDVIWRKKFSDLIKTPIKIFNNNIIIMLTDKVLSINPIDGNINWQFIYKNEYSNLLNSNGGEIVNLNHILYFILPNFQIGSIDTIFGEKNDDILSEFILDNSLKDLTKKIHTYKNLFSFFDNNKFISTINVYDNTFLLQNIKIENVTSSYFFNNSLFTINKDGYFRSHNIINKNIFWKIDLNEYVNYNDEIINITSLDNTLLILFSNGIIIHLQSNDGEIISHKNLKIKNISYINNYNNFIFIFDKDNQVHIYSQ
tara:strand:- start:2637 stop:3902 length:1266 start_codon:yes stop_codon:yes gene_type:complete